METLTQDGELTMPKGMGYKTTSAIKKEKPKKKPKKTKGYRRGK